MKTGKREKKEKGNKSSRKGKSLRPISPCRKEEGNGNSETTSKWAGPLKKINRRAGTTTRNKREIAAALSKAIHNATLINGP